MTQTIDPPSVSQSEDYLPNGGVVPRLSGDIRHLVPKLGLREYWYPLCGVKRVKKSKPTKIRMLGEDLCVFRGAGKDEYVALNDICPHRGARLSEGDCHYEGTVACPYHGWVFDHEGKNIAVLSEGPTSIVCGKPGTEARHYPTKTLKGIIWAWMGAGEPAPIEEDVPEEFFRDDVRIFFNDRIYWHTNWEVGLENSMDAHVQYLHRDHLQALLGGDGVRSGASSGMKPLYTGNGFRSGSPRLQPGAGGIPGNSVDYGNGWHWPKHNYRKWWNWVFSPFFYVMRVESPVMKDPDRWTGGHHLPGIFRAGGNVQAPVKTGSLLGRLFRSRGVSGLYGLYTRQTVPVDEWLTRVWYHHSVVVKNPLQSAWAWFVYFTWGRWTSEYNFSQQDMSVMMHQSYTAPEKLSGTDAEVVQWRKLVVTKHFGGREHPFVYENLEGLEPMPVPGLEAPISTGSARSS